MDEWFLKLMADKRMPATLSVLVETMAMLGEENCDCKICVRLRAVQEVLNAVVGE